MALPQIDIGDGPVGEFAAGRRIALGRGVEAWFLPHGGGWVRVVVLWSWCGETWSLRGLGFPLI